MIIGITGSIGSGKSESAKLISSALSQKTGKQFPIYNADQAVKNIYLNNQSVKNKLFKAFPELNSSKGFVDKNELKQIIKDNAENLKIIESIVHLELASIRKKFIIENDNCILDIPLLFEKSIYKECDCAILIVSDKETRKKRALSNGIDESSFEKYDSIQMPELEKKQYADYIIENKSDIEFLSSELNKLSDILIKKFNI